MTLDRLSTLARLFSLVGGSLDVIVAIGRFLAFVRFVSQPEDL